MTALYILGGFAVLLIFLLLWPVTVRAEYRDEPHVRLNYLFVHYTVVPRPEKEEKAEPHEEEAQQKEKPKQSKISALLKEKGLSGFLNILKQVSEAVSGTAKRLFAHLVITRFNLEISVTGADAAQAALNYGAVYSAVSTAAGLLFGNVRCKSYRIVITPDFQGTRSRVCFEGKARVPLIFLISASLYALIRSLNIMKKLKTTNKYKYE